MVNTDDYDNGAFFSGKITKSILRKRKVVKIKRKKVVKIKKNKMLIQRSKNRNKSKSIKHGKKLFGGSVTKVKQRRVRNIPSYSTRSLNSTSNANNNYRTTSKLSLSKVLSTARQLTPEQQARTANCINYVFNIIGGPRGPIGPAGKDGTPGGSTAECNGYFIDQNLRTTDGVTFNTVEATTSYSLAGVSVTATQWGYLANMDQDVNTTADVTFNTVNGRDIAVDGSNLDALTSIGLTGLTTDEVDQLKNIDTTTISSTQWGYLGAMDQYVGTTANVSFNKVTLADGNDLILRAGQVYMNSPSTTAIDFYINNINRMTISDDSFFPNTATYDLGRNTNRFRRLYLGTSIQLAGTLIGTTEWNHLATIDQDLSTTDDVTFNSVTATTSYSLGSTTIDATQWNHLATIDQDLATTDDVTFNSVTVADGERVNLISTGEVYITSPSTTAMEFYTDNTLRATLSNTSYSPGGNNTQDLGDSTRQWERLYLGSTADLAGTPIGTTQWNYLATLSGPTSDQALNSSSGVTFNSVSVPLSASTSNIRLSTTVDTGFYASDINTIKMNINGIHRYTFENTIGFYTETGEDLGRTNKYWQNLYTNNVRIPQGNTPGNQGIYWGNTTSDHGIYSNTSDEIIIRLAGTDRCKFSSTAFLPITATYNLGQNGSNWNEAYITNLDVSNKIFTNELNISAPTVPGTTGATGTTGDIAWDADYIYVCIATNSWRRAPIVTW